MEMSCVFGIGAAEAAEGTDCDSFRGGHRSGRRGTTSRDQPPWQNSRNESGNNRNRGDRLGLYRAWRDSQPPFEPCRERRRVFRKWWDEPLPSGERRGRRHRWKP